MTCLSEELSPVSGRPHWSGAADLGRRDVRVSQRQGDGVGPGDGVIGAADGGGTMATTPPKSGRFHGPVDLDGRSRPRPRRQPDRRSFSTSVAWSGPASMSRWWTGHRHGPLFNVLEYLSRCFQARLEGQPAPSLLPAVALAAGKPI